MEIFYSEDFISYPDPDRGSRRISDSTGMRNSGFYTGSRSFMVCNPEFSDAKVRYGCDSYDPSGTAGYHIRAYWTSGCDKQNHRKRLVNRPRTSQIPVRGQFLNNGIRTDRISTDNHIWRKYRSYGSDKSIQRPCNRRGCGSVYYLFICWEIVDDDPDNSGTGYRRNLVPFIWYDRSIWSSYSGRLQSRLRKIQKPDVNIHCICNRSVRNICEYRNRVIDRNGSGMCCCHGT